MRNRYAAFTGSAASGVLASLREAHRQIRQGEQHIYDISVPEGAEALFVDLGAGSSGSDLDLYAVNCTQDPCELAAYGAGVGPSVKAWIDEPQSGSWRVVVDAHAVPEGTVAYRYLDLVTHRSFGSLVIEDSPARRAPGEEWRARASIMVGDAPSDRGLAALILVKDATVDREMIRFDPDAIAPKRTEVVGLKVLPLDALK